MLKLELIFVIVVAILGIAFLVELGPTQAMAFQPLVAADFSKILLAVLAIVVIWNLIDIKKRMKEGEAKEEKIVLIPHAVRIYIYLTIGLIAFYCLALQRIGYFTTCFIVLIIFMIVLYYAQNGNLKKTDFVKVLLLGIITTGAIYIVFGMLFQLYLPKGIFI